LNDRWSTVPTAVAACGTARNHRFRPLPNGAGDGGGGRRAPRGGEVRVARKCGVRGARAALDVPAKIGAVYWGESRGLGQIVNRSPPPRRPKHRVNGFPDHRQQDLERLLGERAWLGALARQLVRRDEVADEAAHEAIAAAWVGRVPAGVSPRRWLAAILGRQLAGRRRAQHRRVAREHLAAPAEPAPPTADVVARFEVQRAVADAVLALPEPYRTTILRRFWEAEQPAAIAAAMAVPVETVRTRLKRGLAMLRERLDGAHGGERRAWALPLWLVGGRTDSIAAALLLGVTLMTSLQKVIALAVAAILAVLLWSTWPAPAQPLADARSTVESASAVVAGAPGPAPEADATAGERTEAPVNAATRASRAPEPGLEVTGVVVDDESGAPLAGVPVRLVPWPREPSSEVVAASSADGRFTLRRTGPARETFVFAESAEHAFASAAVAIAPRPDAPADMRGDAGTLRLVRGTWFSGRVVDADGRAVAAALLLLPLHTGHFGGFNPQNVLERFTVVGRSDAAGAFWLQHAIGPDAQHSNLLFAIAAPGIGWCRIAPGKQRREHTDLVVGLRATGAVRLTVLDADGAPRAGVLVRALPRFGPLGLENPVLRGEPSEADPVRALFRAVTDEHGVARFPALPIGEAGVPRLGKVHERAYDLWLEADDLPAQPLLRCELRAGAELDLTARLAGLRRVPVVVEVRDDLGVPIANATIEAGGERAVRAHTDAAGRAKVTVEMVGGRKVGVNATAPGHGHQSRFVDVGPDAAPVSVALSLPRVQPLTGVVVDQLGKPAAGMALMFDAMNELQVTDAEGRFRIEHFPVGAQRLTVGLGRGVEAVHWLGKQEPEVVDAAHGPVRIVAHRRIGRTDVHIAVIDARSGEPLEPLDAALWLYDEQQRRFGQQKRTTTGSGFVAAAATPAGQWRLDVVTATGHRGSLGFDLDGTQANTELRLSLQPPGTLTGRVVFVGVAESERVAVSVRHETADPLSFTRYRHPGKWAVDPTSQSVAGDGLDGTGTLTMQPARNPTFRLQHVDPGQALRLHATCPGAAGEAVVTVASNGTADIVLELRPKTR
jgi:RNA polymerase sigma factor (sigma-70 family)